MRGRTGHENKTVNTYCKHRLRPTLLIEYVAEFWPPSLQPSMDVALVNATLETDQGGSIMRTDGVRVVPARRVWSAIRLRIWKTWRAAATRGWMQYPVRPFVNRSASIAGAFAGSGYRPIYVIGWGHLDSGADAHGSQSGLHCMGRAQ
ncbi:uncharacterized protein ACHE_41279A [Aspergillus chevalieri]|uniref:Uncharacterized protein n=1 Tax=Aspergillus chevalieri TaxID=182096 RepID=A0A7R7ZNB1_ASPCH|nr:uncharacterized protein ACHE_41279A [Aspergillus chevalieri]BCR88715.1 hypothetical protein ACHE_41279A [Aspergillus chevalieri]